MSICKDCICRKYCGDDDIRRCDRYFRDTRIKKEPTNEEWLDCMYTEAKAEWLADHMKCSKCPQQNRCNGYHGGCVALMVEWLKEKHNEYV